MNTKSKILIDKLLGRPVIYIVNLLMLIITKQKRPVNRIVICKFMGMGSIIQSTPMINTLRIKYPNAEITFLTTANNYELLSMFPFIDKIVTINENSVPQFIVSFLGVLKYLFINRIEIFIDLEIYSYFSKIFAALSFAGITIGFFRSGSHYIGIYSTTVCFDVTKPVKNIYLKAASLAGCKILNKELYNFSEILVYNNFDTINQNTSSEDNPLNDISILNDYIVINPNASDLRLERKWPSVNYINLIIHILDLYPYIKIILTGSSSEMAYVSHIHQGINEKFRANVIDTSGKLTLPELIKIIHNSRFMITNDSGPMNLAFALKKKTIALFGPCSPAGYITQPNVEFVYSNIYCSPCVHDFSVSPCHGDNMCMKLICVNEIIKIVKIFMNPGMVIDLFQSTSTSLKRAR